MQMPIELCPHKPASDLDLVYNVRWYVGVAPQLILSRRDFGNETHAGSPERRVIECYCANHTGRQDTEIVDVSPGLVGETQDTDAGWSMVRLPERVGKRSSCNALRIGGYGRAIANLTKGIPGVFGRPKPAQSRCGKPHITARPNRQPSNNPARRRVWVASALRISQPP
jgi:hypothetical protein